MEYVKNAEAEPPVLSPVLFWDTDPKNIHWEEKAAYIISRVVMYGTLKDWNEVKS